MMYVLVTVSGGIIEKVTFFDSRACAISALASYVKSMDPEDEDAAVFGSDGLVANAKGFLDEFDEFIENPGMVSEAANANEDPCSIYLIGNPVHPLGFMVASPDDPLGFENAGEAVSELGQMRADAGNHLKLYRAVPVDRPVVTRSEVEQYNTENDVEDFVFTLVEEYVAG